jgi:hypothetical protein
MVPVPEYLPSLPALGALPISGCRGTAYAGFILYFGITAESTGHEKYK